MQEQGILVGTSRCRESSGTSIREGWHSRHRSGPEVQIWGHLKMGTKAKRGKYPERKGNAESQYRSQKRTVFRRSLRRPLRTESSIIGESGYKRGGKGLSTTGQEMSAGKAAQGEHTFSGLPGPGGKCYLHMDTHSHGPFSHPSPSSAICVDAVVFLSDPSYWNFGRKGEESQEVTEGLGLVEGRGLDPRGSLGRQHEAIGRP